MPLNDTFNMSPDKAIEWFNNKGLVESWNWYDLWEEQHATAFTVAKSMQYDILSDIRDAIKQAQGQGLTKRQFRKLLESKLKSKGWWGRQTVINPKTGKQQIVQLGSAWRLNTIYKTNMQAAMMAGRWKQFWENKSDRPYLQYIAVMDSSTRKSHAALHGKIFHIEDPIWHSIWPPNGFNCRCRVRALTSKQAKQRGFNPNDRLLPDGFPDTGFSHNHGIGRLVYHQKLFNSVFRFGGPIVKNLKDYMLSPVVLEQYQRTVSHIIERGNQTGKYRENIIVLAGFLTPQILSILDVKNGAISLHERLIVGPKAKRKSLPAIQQGTRRRGSNARPTQLSPTDWIALSELMTKPKAILYEQRYKSLIYILSNQERLFKVVVKKVKGNADIRSASYIEGLSQFQSDEFEILYGNIK